MGILSNLFSVKTIDNAVDAVISTGDKLVYTDEEKADMRIKTSNLHIKMLEAYEPFKIAQRALALSFILLYGIAFIVGLIISIFNMVTTYMQITAGVLKVDVVTISLDPLFSLVSAFSVGLIMLTIVAFYFGGGALESYKKGKL